MRQLHHEFLCAEADVMVALTYDAHEQKLTDVGREGRLEQLNRQAVQLVNEVAAEDGALVAGNICNTWSYGQADSIRTGEVVRAQLRWATDEGIDCPDQTPASRYSPAMDLHPVLGASNEVTGTGAADRSAGT